MLCWDHDEEEEIRVYIWDERRKWKDVVLKKWTSCQPLPVQLWKPQRSWQWYTLPKEALWKPTTVMGAVGIAVHAGQKTLRLPLQKPRAIRAAVRGKIQASRKGHAIFNLQGKSMQSKTKRRMRSSQVVTRCAKTSTLSCMREHFRSIKWERITSH